MTSAIKDILRKIDEKTQDGSYIYRGEPEEYPKVSSKLYRNLVKRNETVSEMQKFIKEQHAENPEQVLLSDHEDILKKKLITLNEENLIHIQRDELRIAREHARQFIHVPYKTWGLPTTDAILKKYSQKDLDLLAEIQHMGGSTLLIDFTSNPDVALYFASRPNMSEWESMDKDGRIIILSKDTPETSVARYEPNLPQNRIISQQSVFVVPRLGYIDENLFTTVAIPRELKTEIWKYLGTRKGITDAHIYNDIIGYIEYQKNRFWEVLDTAEEQ